MKALIRNEEIVRETDGIVGIDWTTGAPLTNSEWCGGAYTLVNEYVEPEEVNVMNDPHEAPTAHRSVELTEEDIKLLRKVLG